MKLQNVHTSGKTGKQIESSIFDRVGNSSLVAQAVRVYLSNQRSGTAKAKTRAEVNLTKKKWFKQKGTGNARHGAQSAPIFVGGGVAHGPRGNTNWKLSMSTTMRKRALETALNLQAAADRVRVVEGFEKVSGKTSEIVKALQTLDVATKAVLLVTDAASMELIRASQNIGNLLVCNAKDINTYIVSRAQSILVTPAGLQALETRLGSDTAKKVVVKEETKSVAKKPVARKKKVVEA